MNSRGPTYITILAIAAALGAVGRSTPLYAQFLSGLDGADYQGTPSNNPPNWASVAGAGVKFAIVKATQGYTYTSSSFAYNVKNAAANGIQVGFYHFTDFDLAPTDPQDPIKQANHFLAVIKPYYDAGLYLPPVAD